MAQRTPLPTRLHMIELKQQGLPLAQIAQQLRLSLSCIKKLWRRFRHHGPRGLQPLSCCPKTSHPQQTPEAVRKLMVQIKRAHPHWGRNLSRASCAVATPSAFRIGAPLNGS